MNKKVKIALLSALLLLNAVSLTIALAQPPFEDSDKDTGGSRKIYLTDHYKCGFLYPHKGCSINVHEERCIANLKCSVLTDD